MNNVAPAVESLPEIVVISERFILAHALSDIFRGDANVTGLSVYEDLAGLSGAANQTHLLILDPSRWSPEMVKEIARDPNAPVIAWLRSMSPEMALSALDAGAKGVLGDSSVDGDIEQCVSHVRRGETWVPQEISNLMLTRRTCKLTPRESQLVSLLASGLRNKEIAYSLGIAEGTVKVYMSRLFSKVGVSDRFELALLALRSMGALAPGEECREIPVVGQVAASESIPRAVFPLKLKQEPASTQPSPWHSLASPALSRPRV